MDSEIKIAALIPAAGIGRRIGLPKWQIRKDGCTFLEIIVEKLQIAGIDSINCVYRKNSKPNIQYINYILNKTPKPGMFSSVYYGVRNIIGYDGILIWPVDHPFVKTETLIKLMKCFKINSDKLVKPVFRNRGGHPVILPAKAYSEIKTIDYDGGLRAFLKNTEVEKVIINIEDANVLKNINTAEDLVSCCT